jgi:hypothetical protein
MNEIYGQRITSFENETKIPSMFNGNTNIYSLREKRILSVVLDPLQHFLTSGTPPYTQFKFYFGVDKTNLTGGPVASTNIFGESVTLPDKAMINVLNTTSLANREMQINKVHDVYIDAIITHNARPNNSIETMAFKLNFNEFNIENNTNDLMAVNSIIIPNETIAVNTTALHRARKLNYVTHVTPRNISLLSGSLTMLDGSSIFNAPDDSRIIIDLILVPRND